MPAPFKSVPRPWVVVLLLTLGVCLSAPAAAGFLQDALDNDFPSEIEAAAEEGKTLIIMFHRSGCPYCDKMRDRVFSRKDVQAFYADRFILLQTNMRGDLEVVTPAGEETDEKGFARKMRVRATPVLVFYDTGGTEVLRHTGYLSPEQFILAGSYVRDRAYESGMSFFRYLKEQK